ncbi:hypothetical protein [Endozoicomonas sp. ONNA2]|uniref:hypothetical protein n=1 Tax=Endozoicomonas sp. ONNA2 TaxID=2828741 RepID=UPI0021473D02|nr:hypothetical protein [Endozoicomonas sp. ONNA2]
MKSSQLGINSNFFTRPEATNQQSDKNKAESSARSFFVGRVAKGIRNTYSYKLTKKIYDTSVPRKALKGVSAIKVTRTNQYSADSLAVRGIATGTLIRSKVKDLATGKINVDEFMLWYEPEQRNAVSQAALYNNFEKIKKQLNKLTLLPETTSPLKDKTAVLEISNKKLSDINEKRKAILDTICQIFDEIKTIQSSIPVKTDSPVQLNSGIRPSFARQSEGGSPQTSESLYMRLSNNPKLALQLHKHPDDCKAITSELTQLMNKCEINILNEGRIRPKGLSREECRRFFFACCAWQPEDIHLIGLLQKVKPQKQVITQLTTLICDHFMEESLNIKTSHSWLTTREEKYKDEAKLARGRFVLEEHKTDSALLQNIIGRPQGLREDLKILCIKISELMASKTELVSCRKDIRKKLVKLRTKSEAFLSDIIRNKDLLVTNNFTISSYYGLRAVIRDIPNPPVWSKHWPYIYADHMKATGKKER